MIVKLLTEHRLEFFKFKGRLHRLVGVYTCQNATLLEITCHGSNVLNGYSTGQSVHNGIHATLPAKLRLYDYISFSNSLCCHIYIIRKSSLSRFIGFGIKVKAGLLT